MELKKQVCSLELAKRIKELGVKQDSLCFYLDYEDIRGVRLVVDEWQDAKEYKTYSAYTVAELGEMLPDYLTLNHNILQLDILKIETDWVINYRIGCAKAASIGIRANTEADARAKMLIYLIENKLINT